MNPSLKTDDQRREENLYVIGHRGAAGLAPENTLCAFSKALDLGVDGVELDVQLSADGIAVVHHDFQLNPDITRTAAGEWLESGNRLPIKDLTLAELKRYDVGRLKPDTTYANRYPDQRPVDGERIPTLQEAVLLLKGREDDQTQLWIEIKTSPEEPEVSQRPEPVTDAVVAVLGKEAFSARAMILSFDWRALVHVQKISPEIPTVYLSPIGTRWNSVRPGQPEPAQWTAGIDVGAFDGSIPRAVKAAGLSEKRGLTFHSLRHTFAVHFLEGGAAVTDLKGALGHSNLATTQIYAEMVDERMNASIEALSYGLETAERGQVRISERISERINAG